MSTADPQPDHLRGAPEGSDVAGPLDSAASGPGRLPSTDVDVTDRGAFAQYLEQARITGPVATPREDNLAHIQGFLDGVEHLEFGVRTTHSWTWPEVFEVMVRRAGLDPDPAHATGQDTIGTRQCLEELEVWAGHFGRHVRAGSRILFATGHPAGLFPLYQPLASAARAGGATVLGIEEGIGFLDGDLRQIDDVVMFQQYGALAHTHLAGGMRLVLEQLEAAGRRPDLVVADHGWAGAAASVGIDTLGIADSNDPGLFVSREQGQILAAVPMDDNVVPHLYAPVARFLLHAALGPAGDGA